MAIYETSPGTGQLRQGEIVTGLQQATLTLTSIGSDTPDIEFIEHPIAIVATQDCDLAQDYGGRNENLPARIIPCVLLYEVIPATTLMSLLPAGSDIRRRVLNNKDERYHVLQEIPAAVDAVGEGLPHMGIDFKRYFTLPTAEAYVQMANGRRRAVLVSPYLEHFSSRAAIFQFRVALPVDHVVTPQV